MSVRFAIESSHTGLRGLIRAGRRRHSLFFSSASVPLRAAPEAFTLLALPAAMRLGVPLEVPYPVSPQLIENLPAIQSLLSRWTPGTRVIPVEAEPAIEMPSSGPREGLFFTGGVDSFYTALKRPGADFVYVLGLDIRARQGRLYSQVQARLDSAAGEMGRNFVELQTDVRSYLDRYSPWLYVYGLTLAAIAQLLSPQYGRLNLSPSFRDPQSDDDSPALIDGSHAGLVALLGSEHVSFCAVGRDARRIDKLRALAQLPAARSALRVCWENRGQAYNCGACEKCLRTMVGLAALGQLDDFKVFSRPLNLAAVARSAPGSAIAQNWLDENLEAARAGNADPQLIASLETARLAPAGGIRGLCDRYMPLRAKGWLYRLSSPWAGRQ